MSEVDWAIVGSASLLSGIISVLTSISTGLLTKVGGAKYSQHVQGKAADIVISGVTPYEVAQSTLNRSELAA